MTQELLKGEYDQKVQGKDLSCFRKALYNGRHLSIPKLPKNREVCERVTEG